MIVRIVIERSHVVFEHSSACVAIRTVCHFPQMLSTRLQECGYLPPVFDGFFRIAARHEISVRPACRRSGGLAAVQATSAVLHRRRLAHRQPPCFRQAPWHPVYGQGRLHGVVQHILSCPLPRVRRFRQWLALPDEHERVRP